MHDVSQTKFRRLKTTFQCTFIENQNKLAVQNDKTFFYKNIQLFITGSKCRLQYFPRRNKRRTKLKTLKRRLIPFLVGKAYFSLNEFGQTWTEDLSLMLSFLLVFGCVCSCLFHLNTIQS